MSLILDATAKGASSNSNCTVAEADSYHEEHLYASDWTDASTASKTTALVWATRLLNEQFVWTGVQTTTTQALRWPRVGIYDQDRNLFDKDLIPQFLINATAEYARYLLAADQTATPGTKGIKSLVAGDLELVFDKYDRAPTIPNSVYSMLKPYGKKASGLQRTLERM